jgi:TetR/AcrR family transcriptional regulator, cholesterol catabolism regulator
MTKLARTAIPTPRTKTPAEPPAPSVLTAKQRARRQRVIDAGLELLETRDYDKIQVKDVAERAEVALGTLYHYFSSKEHLFAEVLVKWAATLRTDITKHPLKSTTPADQLVEALHRSLRAFERQPQLAKLVGTVETSADPYAAEIHMRLERTMRGIYVELLEGIEPETATAIVKVVEAVFGSMLRTWSVGRIEMSVVREQLDETVALLLNPR